jgi:dTDP-4-amino-4,6-dideoxygalactose transaminase
MNPYQVVEDFEYALSEYTGAPYVVCVSSCTAALQLACMWTMRNRKEKIISIPKNTYISVPMAITNAGNKVLFRNEKWSGEYQLQNTRIWDCACRFTSGMHVQGRFQCVSFASNKILGIEQGGAILYSSKKADKWFRRMRFDGRTEGVDPKDDTFDLIGLHVPMLPSIAAQGILRLHHLPKHNEDLVFEYPDLSNHEAFK